MRIASRHPEQAWRLKPLAQLGQLQFARCDATRPGSVAAAVAGADAVVNLVGTFEGDLMAARSRAARKIARAAAEAGCEAFVHVSAIGADPDSPAGYARAKAASERAVLAAFPRATVLRPSVLFGEDDGFVNMFARAGRAVAGAAGVRAGGGDPAAVRRRCRRSDRRRARRSRGARRQDLRDRRTRADHDARRCNERIAAAQNRKRAFLPVPDGLSALFAALPGTPMNTDQWILLKGGNRPSGTLPGIAAFGIAPRPLSLFLDRWMTRYRTHGRFNERLAG